MPRESAPSLNESTFLLGALREKVRLDGRALEAYRGIELRFGDVPGLADLRLGRTRFDGPLTESNWENTKAELRCSVVARISAEVTRPYADRPFNGVFTIATELSPMASPAFEVGRQTEQEVILARILEKAIRRSNALDTESLCIVAGHMCWNVRADIHVLDYDGGLTDASCVAVIAALRHFRRPDVTVDGEDVTVYSPAERVPVPLSILHHPYCTTFSFYHGGEITLVDATLQEEQLREAELVVSLNGYGEVCQLAKLGGASIDALTLLRCVETATSKAREIEKIVTVRLEQDMTARDGKNIMAELQAENDR